MRLARAAVVAGRTLPRNFFESFFLAPSPPGAAACFAFASGDLKSASASGRRAAAPASLGARGPAPRGNAGASLATLGFFGYAALMGVALAPIMVIYTGASLATTFGVAAGMFGSMAVVGNLTKRDLTSMGSMLGMATWGLMLAMLANMWFKSGTTDLIISGFGVVIFTGLSAYDAQRIKRIQESGVEGDDAARLAVLCALHMYMNVIQIFLFLLRFLGNRRER